VIDYDCGGTMSDYDCSRTAAAVRMQPGTSPILEREKSQELSLLSCLDDLGISSLSEWDVLAFVYHHGVSLTNADHIARLLGYESTVVADALDRLERNQLVERSRPCQGARLYRIPVSTDVGCRGFLQHLIFLSESRSGRLLLTEQLKPVRPESEREGRSARV
jgi:hypothetical protein